MPLVKPRLIPQWRRWYTLWSIRLNLIGSTLMGVYMAWPGLVLDLWNQMPDEIKAHVPPRLMLLLASGFFLAAMGARVIKQKNDGCD